MDVTREPAEGIATICQYKTSHGYRILCSCGDNGHNVDAWIDVTPDGSGSTVDLEFFIEAGSPYFSGFWSRIKAAWRILTGGHYQLSHSVVLRESAAKNLLAALDGSISSLRKVKGENGS